MNGDYRAKQSTGRMIAGSVIVTLGVVHLLNNLNLVGVGPFATRWWPLVFIIVGLQLILVRRHTVGLAGGIFWIATGSLFLAATSGYLNVAMPRLIWPVLVIWFGLFLILKLPRCGEPRGGNL